MKDDKNMPQEFKESEHNRAQNIYDIQLEFIKRDIQDIKSEARETRKELTTKIDNAVVELRSELGETRKELTTKIDNAVVELRSELGETRKELTTKIDNAVVELRSELSETRKELNEKIDSNFKWMLSVFGGGFGILLGYMWHMTTLISKLHG